MKQAFAFLASLLEAARTPIARIRDEPAWAKAIAIGMAGVQYVVTDTFGGAALLVIGGGIVEYHAGILAAKHDARKKGVPYDCATSRDRRNAALCGLFLLLLVRGAEGYLSAHQLLETRGLAAAFVAVSLFLGDLQSIEQHRVTLGSKPIPFLSAFIAKVEGMLSSKIEVQP